jgi:cell division inhibitor SepF
MATAMKRLGVYLGLVEDDPNYDGSGGAYGGYREPVTPPRPVAATATAPVSTAATSSTASVSTLRRDTVSDDTAGAIDPYAIHTIHPRSYNDARRIGEEFREGVPVIMNLTEMDDIDAKRLVDFSAGLVFGCRGTIERVTNKVFLLSPTNVDVAAEARRLAQDGFFNQS